MSSSITLGGPPQVQRAPFRLLVLADLMAAKPVQPTLLREAKDLHLLLADCAPQLLLEVPNELSDLPASWEVRLELRSYKELALESLQDKLPALAPLRQLQHRLEAVSKGAPLTSLQQELDSLGDLPGLEGPLRLCRQALAQAAATTPGAGPAATKAAAAPEPTADDAVNRIMELVELPSAEERASSVIGKVVGAVGAQRKGRAKGGPSQLGEALEQLNRLIARQTRALLECPALQRLEATWRGLKLLVDRTEFRKEIQIAVLHQPLPAPDDPVVVELVEATDVDLVLAPLLLEDPATDAALVQWLAERAEALGAPLVVSLGCGFFGLDAADVETMRYPGNLFEQPQYTKWNALRQKDCARWVTPVFNRFLLRAPVEAEGSPAQEPGLPALYGDPVWLVGALVARSLARVGWPTELSRRAAAEVEDLPVHTRRSSRGRKVGLPLECIVPQQLAEDLAGSGILAFAAQDNSDAALAPYTPTLHQPAPKERASSLPYQLAASRLARQIASYLPQLSGVGSASEACQQLELFAASLIADTGVGAAVQADPLPGEQVKLQLRTGKGLLGGVLVELVFRLPR